LAACEEKLYQRPLYSDLNWARASTSRRSSLRITGQNPLKPLAAVTVAGFCAAEAGGSAAALGVETSIVPRVKAGFSIVGSGLRPPGGVLAGALSSSSS